MYSDDTIIYYAASDTNHLLQVMNDEVKFLLDWSIKKLQAAAINVPGTAANLIHFSLTLCE